MQYLNSKRRSVKPPGRSILVFTLSLIVCLNITPANAQQKTSTDSSNRGNSWVLNGSITNETGEPMPGVSITALKRHVTIISSTNGSFILEINHADEILSLSYVGYKTLQIAPGTQRKITIKMEVDSASQKLNDVVVVGYGTQKKLSVTGAIASVPAKNLQRIATPSLSNALAGSMPGIVTRQSSGEPGYDGAQIFVRGFGTWQNRSPLILIDGVQRDINSVNVQEVETVTMLKDASATAVYGVQGANGVILITTKRGVQGKPRVVFRTENAILTALRLPDYINGGEYAKLINEALTNSELPVRYQPSELQKFEDGSDPYLYPNVNWTDVVLKKNTSQSINNLGITGGSDVIKYYVNIGYSLLNGIYKEDHTVPYNTNAQLKRYNFRSNVDIKVSQTISLQLGLGGIIQQGNYPGTIAPEIFRALKITSPINFPVTNPDGSVSGGTTSYLQNNPWGFVARSGYTRQDRNTGQGTFAGKWDLSSLVTKGLSISGVFSYDHFYSASTDRKKIYAIRQYLGKDASGNDMYANPNIREEQPMQYAKHDGATRAIYQEASINYNRTFKDHAFTALALVNRREFIDLTASSSKGNLPYRRQGLAGRLTYAYHNRYLAELNAGYNGSENFPPGKQYGFFPSVSIGWNVSNEAFWKSDLITQLKVRGSYGQVGNDQIGGDRFLFLSKITTSGQSTHFGDNHVYYQGIDESNIGNPNVSWEVSNKGNIGLDMELLNGKIVFQLDAFQEKRKGILIQRGAIPRVTGFYPWIIPYANLGAAENKGFDAMLEIKDYKSNSFFYNVRGSFTFAKSIATKNDEPTPKYPYQSYINLPIDQPMGLVALGFFKDQAEIDKSPRQKYITVVRPGDIKYQDTNGDGVIDDFDRVAIGYPRTPQIVYGAGGTVGYKSFELSLFFQGVARTSSFVDGPSMFPFEFGLGTYNIMREYYDHRWVPGTDNSGARYPAVSAIQNVNNNRTNTMYLRDASYIRLKSAEIAYTLKSPSLKKYGVSETRIFVNGMNLYTWDKIKVIDPEAEYGTGGYPLQRSFNFGLQVTFQ